MRKYVSTGTGVRLHIFKTKFIRFFFLPPARNGGFLNPCSSLALLQVVFIYKCYFNISQALIGDFFTFL